MSWRAYGKHAGQGQARIRKAAWKVQVAWDFGGQRSAFGTHRRDHDFGSAVQSRARIVEGIDGGAGVKVQVALPIHAFENVAKKGWHVVNVEPGIVALRDDEQILGERKPSSGSM